MREKNWMIQDHISHFFGARISIVQSFIGEIGQIHGDMCGSQTQQLPIGEKVYRDIPQA